MLCAQGLGAWGGDPAGFSTAQATAVVVARVQDPRHRAPRFAICERHISPAICSRAVGFARALCSGHTREANTQTLSDVPRTTMAPLARCRVRALPGDAATTTQRASWSRLAPLPCLGSSPKPDQLLRGTDLSSSTEAHAPLRASYLDPKLSHPEVDPVRLGLCVPI